MAKFALTSVTPIKGGFSFAADLMQKERVSINDQFDIQNLINELFLCNFESVFSGTHVGYPRLFSGRLSFRFK